MCASTHVMLLCQWNHTVIIVHFTVVSRTSTFGRGTLHAKKPGGQEWACYCSWNDIINISIMRFLDLSWAYRISANRRRSDCLFCCPVWCGDYSRAALITLGSMTAPHTQHPYIASSQLNSVDKLVRRYGS